MWSRALPSAIGRRLLNLLLFLLGGTLAADWQQHFLLTGSGLTRFLAFRRLGVVGDAPFQRIHQVYNILAFWSGFRTNHLAVTLGIDQFGQRGLVVILEFLRFELASLL